MGKLPPYTKESWKDALQKVRLEGECRVCKLSMDDVKLDAAHTINRALQDTFVSMDHWGPEGRGEDGKINREYRYVEPLSVVPLCSGIDSNRCHELYDAHKLDLLPYLSKHEQGNAVAAVGILSALKRLTSNKKGNTI